jgi:hypothetical protein
MVKSAKLPANGKKIRTLCAENLRSLSWHMATIERQHFCHSREKATHKYDDEIDA